MNAFIPGITDIINGVDINAEGDTINTVSYAERIAMGKRAQEALKAYGIAREAGDSTTMASSLTTLRENYPFFGYGYFKSVDEAIPPVGLTFVMFRVMVVLGSYFLLFFIVVLFLAYKSTLLQKATWLQWIAICSVPFMWICSEAGWAVAEVGRQPWTVQDLLPTIASVSAVPASSVIITFWLFALIFTVLLVAEVSIMCRQISKHSTDKLS